MMKHFLIVLFFFSIMFSTQGQTNVTLLPKNDLYCFGGTALFNLFIIPDTTEYVLQWKRNGQPIFVEDSLTPKLRLSNLSYADTGYYTVEVKTAWGTLYSDTAYLYFRPSLTIDTLYRYNKLGCPGTCKGQMKVHVSGGNPPYHYDWGGGSSQDTIVTSLCKGDYVLTVYDSDTSRCVSRSYKIEVLTLPKIDFVTDPQDTVFLTNPTLTAQYPDTSAYHLSNWEWIFNEGDNDSTVVSSLNPVQHIYSKTGRFAIQLHYTDVEGCDTTVMDSITVMIADLFFPNVFTPNGDVQQMNETFVIKVKNAEDKTINDVYESNRLTVLNRWGKKVFDKENYVVSGSQGKFQGEWDGGNLGDGVYFYIFTGNGYYGKDTYKGYVTIMGSKVSGEVK